MHPLSNNLILTYEYVTLNKNPLLSRTNHSTKSVLTNKWKFSVSRQVKLPWPRLHEPENQYYPLSSGNHSTNFGN